jgi:Spy/CpxP family protein refolding chaperone
MNVLKFDSALQFIYGTQRLILMFVGVVLVGSVVAETPAPKGIGKNDPISGLTISRVMNPFSERDLTSEQQVERRKINKQDRRGIALALAHVHIAREDLEQAILNNPRDETSTRQKSAVVGNAVAELTTLKALHDARLLQILTPEQLRKFQRDFDPSRREWLVQMLDRYIKKIE